MIHLGLHLRLVVDGKCKGIVDKSKKLIEEELNRIFDAKISTISLSVSKSFLVKH